MSDVIVWALAGATVSVLLLLAWSLCQAASSERRREEAKWERLREQLEEDLPPDL